MYYLKDKTRREPDFKIDNINPKIVNKSGLFFNSQGILNVDGNGNKKFLCIKTEESSINFWLTYLFLDNQHDLVGGARVFDSLPKYSKGAKKWNKNFSPISILRLYGTMFYDKPFDKDKYYNIDYSLIKIKESSENFSVGSGKIERMSLLVNNRSILKHYSPNNLHDFFVNKRKDEVFIFGKKERKIEMKRCTINEAIISFGDTSYLPKEILENNKELGTSNLVRGLDNEHSLSQMSGIWGALQHVQKKRDTEYKKKHVGGKKVNSTQHGGVSDHKMIEHVNQHSVVLEGYEGFEEQNYHFNSWKGSMLPASYHLRLIVDSSKAGKTFYRLSGAEYMYLSLLGSQEFIIRFICIFSSRNTKNG